MYTSKTEILFLLLLISSSAFSQKRKDTVAVYNYPVKNGYIELFNSESSGCRNQGSGISIYSKENDVFAVKDGVVKRVFDLEGSDYIFVKSGDTSIVYGNLDKALTKVGDTIRVGKFIGKIKKEASDDKYELSFVILAGRKKISDDSYIKFLKRFKKQ